MVASARSPDSPFSQHPAAPGPTVNSAVEFFSHQTDFKFMATRHVWYGLSAILVIASLVMIFTRGLNLAIDFTGGVSAQATFPVTADLGAVRRQLATTGFSDAQVQSLGSSRNIAIRLPPSKMNQEVLREHLEAALRAVNPGAALQQLSVVGPQVGSESPQRRRSARSSRCSAFHLHRRSVSIPGAFAGCDPRGHT